MSAPSDLVLLDVSPEGVAVVTLNAPEKRNAFDEQMNAALSDIFRTLKTADHVRIIFLRGAGPTFCAGADAAWMVRAAKFTEAENEEDALGLARMLHDLHELPQLTVAVVQGGAMGGGAGLVAACDMAVAVRTAKFRFSEVLLGLTPATISPYVIEAIGPRWAKALFVSAEMFDGALAERIGLVQYAVDTEAELQTMMEHLAELALATAPGAVRDAKLLIADFAGRKIDDSLARDTAKRIAKRRVSDEGRKGLAAFLEKRKPEWNG